MSHALAKTSPRRRHAQAFGRLLRATLAARGVGEKRLVAITAPGPYGSPENRRRTLAGARATMERLWADPAFRERRVEMTRRMHRDGTITGEKISAGRRRN